MKDLSDLLERIRQTDRPDLLWWRPAESEGFEPISARCFLGDVDRCASGLAKLGLGRGDRVGLIAENRPEWHLLDFACHRLGAVLVPLFPTLTPSQVQYCLENSGCRVAVVEDVAQLRKLAEVAETLEDLERSVIIEAGDTNVPMSAMPFSELIATGEEVASDVELLGPESSESLATIIYTSGTTGPPKGVMLTHANFLANIEGVLHRLPLNQQELCVSALPLCHAFERTVDFTYFAAGCSIAYSSPENLGADLPLLRPHVMVGVPRLYEKLREAVEGRIADAPRFQQRIFGLAVDLGSRCARLRLLGEPMSGFERLLHTVLDRVILRRVRMATGGRVRMFSAGGAALDPKLNWWFEAVGWPLIQGYGLTEAAPIISSNSPDANRIGTVGRPLHNVEVRIDDDGEILTRGPHVMRAYWNRPEETAAAIVDDWLRTGDVGEIDDDGFLVITDRKKQILVTSTGENVAPQPVENTLTASRYIAQALVVGDNRKFVAALLVPEWQRLRSWASERRLPDDLASLSRSPEVHELIAAELERLQVDLARYQRVREYRLIEEPFTIDNGMMTPTMKLVRQRIMDRYAAMIEGIYAS